MDPRSTPDPGWSARICELLAEEIGSSIAIRTHLLTGEEVWTGALARRCRDELEAMARMLAAERDRLLATAATHRRTLEVTGP